MTQLIELRQLSKSFQGSDGQQRLILQNIDFNLADGEIVALLGKSGCGKSTLLRIIAGLIAADQGQANYRAQTIYGPVKAISMVFQSFALFPWLTVQQNVELGLEAQAVPAKERRQRADAVLELIGLAGFGNALPRELSGGMKQRVGIARALVMEPEVLLMDEAFSALDVLTGETLRNDMLELWQQKRIKTRGMVVVSHNIEEAVMMADRIIILDANPGRIAHDIRVDFARPRQADDAEVRALIDEVYGLMTARPASADKLSANAAVSHGYHLPDTDIDHLESVLDLLASSSFAGKADLPQFAEAAELSDDDLFPVYEALSLLGLAHIEHADLSLTELGRRYVAADQSGKQELFGQQVLLHIPLAAYIRRHLEAAAGNGMPEKLVLQHLAEFMNESQAEQVLNTVIAWARYGEVFSYDYHTGILHLPQPHQNS